MMILDRLQQIEVRAQAARDDGSLRQDLIKLDRITQRVAALARSLQKLSTSYDELVCVKRDECESTQNNFRIIHTELTQMVALIRTQQLGGATSQFAERVSAAERATKAIEGVLGEAWSGFRNEHRRSAVDRELLELLDRSGIDVGDLLESYDKASFGLKMLSERALPLIGDVAKWQTHLDELRRVSEGMSGVVPSAIAEFFRQTDTSIGAPLSALTDEVRAFLETHNIADRYSIKGRR